MVGSHFLPAKPATSKGFKPKVGKVGDKLQILYKNKSPALTPQIYRRLVITFMNFYAYYLSISIIIIIHFYLLPLLPFL